jgi:hypothetical protein
MSLGLLDEAAQREAGPLPRIVLVDANIFFAPRLRDLFMHLHELLTESPDVVVAVAEGCRKKLQTPRVTREDYIGLLVRNGCTGLARALALKWRLECPVVRKDGTIIYESESVAKRRPSPPTG